MATIGYNKTADARPSPGIWDRCSAEDFPDNWTSVWEDFASFDQTADLASGDFSFINSGAGTAVPQTDHTGGVVLLSNENTGDDEVTLVTGDNVAGFMKFTNGKKFGFETRIQVAQIVTQGIFLGMAEEALGGALFHTDDVMEDKDYVGWKTIKADADVIEPVFNTEGGTEVVVKADAQTLVADTWYKLGMWFDGTHLSYYINGVAITGTDESHPVKYSVSNFPDGEEMAAYVGLGSLADGVANTMHVDWIRAAFERD